MVSSVSLCTQQMITQCRLNVVYDDEPTVNHTSGHHLVILGQVSRVLIMYSVAFSHSGNEMKGGLGHISDRIGETGPGEPPEDGEMNEMTLQLQDSKFEP